MKLRPILAVVAGYAAWVVGFWVPNILLALVWPALRETAAIWSDQGRYDVFDTSMLVAFQFTWPIANAAAGFVTRLISGRQFEVWCLAALLLGYFAYNHLYAIWDQLPAWYNIIVIIPVVPMVIAGSLVAQLVSRRNAVPDSV